MRLPVVHDHDVRLKSGELFHDNSASGKLAVFAKLGEFNYERVIQAAELVDFYPSPFFQYFCFRFHFSISRVINVPYPILW